MNLRSLLSPLSIIVLLTFITFLSGTAQAQERPNFELAERFTGDNMQKMTGSTNLRANWIEDQEQFWYEWEDAGGTRWMYVDAARQQVRPLFDRERMAAELSEEFNRGFDSNNLELRGFDYDTDRELFTFHVDSIEFKYYVDNNQLVKGDSLEAETREPWATYSPDSTWIAFAREHDLYVMRADDPDSNEIRLTEDGERWYSFQADHGDTTSTERLRSRANWFEDSEKLYVKRQDWRDVDELWVINNLEERPELETYKYAMPGEEDHYQDEILVFDMESKEHIRLDTDKWPDQSLGGAYFSGGGIFETETSDYLYILRRTRTWDEIDVLKANTTTGEVEVLWSETSKPYFNTRYAQLAIINEGEEYIWWSERTGWGQLYRYDSEGNMRNRITTGHFMVGDIAAIDTTAQTIYFQGYGAEEDRNPYHAHYYKVNFDGSGQQLVTPENANHSVSMSDSRRYFVDSFSRPDLPPKAVLRDNRGREVLQLEETDLTRMFDAGYNLPELFSVKAADGVTDLYGVMWKPSDFDPEKEYPVISYVYPGPQVEPYPRSFSIGGSAARAHALSQVGFVVVAMGNRGGSPLREKWYHNYGHGNLRDYALADNRYGIEQLGALHSYIDLDRVGIYGHSGGGFMSTAALLSHPDFFKVAVSSAGNHDNNVYNIWWSEVHHGVEAKTDSVTVTNEEGEEVKEERTTFSSRIPSNSELASNLQGRLLLVHGEMDNNVHPANTYRLADALLREGKRFDMMIFPEARHGFGRYSDYFERMLWDYFAEHLMGYYPTEIDYNLPD
ncbi:S9 family peptidase [Rhodohalobacter mucosus]|uniref:S9 family peptidase n=1 Tax=Rhodohalobacter mucosus TaxID=2079485 RepID=A0A316TYL7_9BACT|nr:DPP IV N-terminal domain-containing protein [Rhodohalobacter mucosus]PWN07894.1 S9 family peptidase [Rhodohalobacter mucosus]